MDYVKAYELARAAYRSDGSADNKENYVEGFVKALKMIEESGFSMCDEGELDDPRLSYVNIQVDKDVYKLFYPKEATDAT